MRGEYLDTYHRIVAALELPPRARRILAKAGTKPVGFGTTSACAENTEETHGEQGEREELPPRARRILAGKIIETILNGTTSACAENTDSIQLTAALLGNYLRVRGEYPFFGQVGTAVVELPPRARRILI